MCFSIIFFNSNFDFFANPDRSLCKVLMSGFASSGFPYVDRSFVGCVNSWVSWKRVGGACQACGFPTQAVSEKTSPRSCIFWSWVYRETLIIRQLHLFIMGLKANSHHHAVVFFLMCLTGTFHHHAVISFDSVGRTGNPHHHAVVFFDYGSNRKFSPSRSCIFRLQV